MTGFAHKSRSEQHSPPFQGGEVRDIKLERREATLCGANGVVKIEPQSAPYFVEVTNRPVCAKSGRGRLIDGAATPPWKGGECRHRRRMPI
jgi:hypothetical protein